VQLPAVKLVPFANRVEHAFRPLIRHHAACTNRVEQALGRGPQGARFWLTGVEACGKAAPIAPALAAEVKTSAIGAK